MVTEAVEVNPETLSSGYKKRAIKREHLEKGITLK